MKKVILMVVAVMMATMSVNAQEAGRAYPRVYIGGTLATLTGNDAYKQNIGCTVGMGLDYFFTKKFAASIDLSDRIFRAKNKATDKNMSLEYIGINPMAKYYVKPWLALQGGPEISFLVHAKMDGESYTDNFKETEFSLPLGVSFEPRLGNRKLLIDLRYHLGLSHVNKSGAYPDNMRNSALILNIGFNLFSSSI